MHEGVLRIAKEAKATLRRYSLSALRSEPSA